MPSENREEKKRERTFPVSSSEVEPTAGNLEAERSGKGVWYPEEHDRDIWGRFRASIARQAFSPGEAIMCPLRPGKQSNWRGLSWQNCFRQSNIDTLVTKELHHLPPMEATLPVSPEHRMRNWW